MNVAMDEAIARWANEVSALYGVVTTGVGSTFQEAGFLPVNNAVAERINIHTGLQVSGYEHIVDSSSIRHILRNHGTMAEYKRGQVPITIQDLLQLSQLLLSPDTIEHAGKTKQGRDVLHYTKVTEEHTVFYTEELRTKKSRLAAVTLYKRKNAEK